MDVELWNVVLGGGGAISIITALISWQKDRAKGKLMKEDTAIARLKEDYDRKKREAEKAWRIVAWFRLYYPRLWAAYMRLPPEDKEEYPPTPPPEIDN